MRAPLLFLLGITAPALAQQSPPDTTVSPELSIEQAKLDLAEIHQHRDAVIAQWEAVGDDPATAQCVLGPANALRALAEVADASFQSMNRAFASGEDARGAYEARKIGIATSKARELRARAEACQGTAGTSIFDFDAEGDAGENPEIDPGNSDIGADPPGTTPFE